MILLRKSVDNGAGIFLYSFTLVTYIYLLSFYAKKAVTLEIQQNRHCGLDPQSHLVDVS